MGKRKYPVGIQNFEKLRKEAYLYVDKTAIIQEVSQFGGYYFLSRPRRFGKSLLISTIECLFQGKKELFDGLFIADKWDWKVTHPIIRISFSNIGHKTKGLIPALSEYLTKTAERYDVVLTETALDTKFKELIEKLHEARNQVVVLIDEYDKPIIDYLGKDTAKAVENREIMKTFYSILKDADPHLKMVFITGVTKFARVSIFSDLNNLTDLTVDRAVAGICGITQKELVDNFTDELKQYDLNKIKEWYNGYTWDLKTYVYNPFSLLHFFRAGEFKNFWFESGTPTFLINLTKQHRLYDFEAVPATLIHLSSFDIEKLQIIPIMFQAGYLTLQSQHELTGIYTLGYPNKEVERAYLEVLADVYIDNQYDRGIILADKLRQALMDRKLDRIQPIVNTLFKSVPYVLWQKENEHFYHAILHLTFRLLGIFVESEVHTADGRMDALVKLKDTIYCFEFKLDQSAEIALQQIVDKGYLTPYLHQKKTCIAVGINFSIKDKKVEKILWETIV